MGKNTPTAVAKKEKNVQAAAERLAQLQAKQAYANRLRKSGGYIGTDDEICQQRLNEIFSAAIQAEQEKERKQQELLRIAAERLQQQEEQYVNTALNGIHGKKLKAFLAGRPATPARVKRFLANVA